MSNRLAVIFLGCASALLLLIAALSLQWRMTLDSPIMMYLACLIDRFHCVPYRDFFDMNLPGTYLVNLVVGRCFGYTDLGFRCADLLYLSAILFTTWLWMKPLGWKSAWCGVVLVGFYYLSYGPEMSMQREYLLLLPISLAVLVASCDCRLSPFARVTLVGLLFGCCATIKPHAAIAFPWILRCTIRNTMSDAAGGTLPGGQRPRLGTFLLIPIPTSLSKSGLISVSLFGFAAPVLWMIAYLAKSGALPAFLDMARRYLPLYVSLDRFHQTTFGIGRIGYLLLNFLHFGERDLWFSPAVLGTFIALFRSGWDEKQRRHVVLLAGLVVCYCIYPLLSGQFWTYHWLPFGYFIVLASSLCLVHQPMTGSKAERCFPIVVLLLVIGLSIRPPRQFFTQITGHGLRSAKMDRVDAIASYLKANLKPGDSVQPLDWTGGAVQAMLIARARLATPFVYDFHFYHHVSRPYIQQLRQRFLTSLKASKPRFIIQIETDKPWVSGRDTTRRFEGLERILAEDYTPVVNRDGYRIYERRG